MANHMLEELLPVTETLGANAPLSGDQVLERAARAAWLTIAEPGDRVAGTLIAELGAAESFDWLLSARRSEYRGELQQALERWEPRLDADRIIQLVTAGARLGAALCVPGDPAWPDRLDNLGAHAPIGLWLRGEVSLLARPGAAVVGSRASSPYGDDIAQEIAYDLAEHGLSTISGGAYGIDAAAHRAALAGDGMTVAVMAGGCDRLYPSGNRELLESILAEGLIVSELPPGQSPTRWRFLQRNRVVAALAAATVVVEAGARSGALNTANHASTLGRPLGAVPGPVRSASSVGCHRLIRENGAVLVTGPEDVRELIGSSWCSARQPTQHAGRASGEGSADGAGHTAPSLLQDAEQRRVLDAMPGRGTLPADELARRAGLGIGATNAALIGLELDGFVEHSGNGWRLLRKRRRSA